MSGEHPNKKSHPKIPPDQIFYPLYAGVHPIGTMATPAKLGCTPGSIWTSAGAVMKGVFSENHLHKTKLLFRFRPGLIGIDALSGVRSNFSSSMYLEDEENGRDIKAVDVIKTKMNAKLYRPITEEVKFRDMTPAVPWLVILVIGVFVIVAGISYLHMVCARSKQADA